MLTVRLKHLGLKPGDRVLDLGCGEGRHCHGVHMLGGVHVVGLDIDIPSLTKARDGVEMLPERTETDDALTGFLSGSGYALPFADDTFDAVICSEVLEHLHEYKDAIAEIRRVLKPGGVFAATVPHAWPERLCWKLAPAPNGYPLTPGGHLRIFNDRALAGEIEQAGFKEARKVRHHAHGLHSPYWWLQCLVWETKDTNWFVRQYHKLLVWEIMKRPWLTRALEAVLGPVMGKSVCLYFRDKT